MDQYGNVQFTETNAYSGNNGRAAILNTAANTIYTAGNAGNGSKPEPKGVVTGTGSQILSPNNGPESGQSPGATTPLGAFNIVQTGAAKDTAAKDTNFRGLTISNNVVYTTKGSGSNGIDTVYFLDTTGTSCPTIGTGGGVGLPSSTATLPAASTWTPPAYSTSNTTLSLTTANPGLTPTNMCILKGFPTALASTAPKTGTPGAFDYPFGIWFANQNTVYVADEGSGDNTYSASTGGPLGEYTIATGQTNAGLQKWSFNGTSWVLDYVLQNGLNLGQPYTVPSYPTGTNSVTSLPWAPAVDGLRNLTGHVNGDGTVSLYAATSTVSGGGDQGADPNALVSITDNLAATSLPTSESFTTLMAPTYGQVVRGVAFVPTTQPDDALPEAPWLPMLPIAGAAVVGGGFFAWHRRLRLHASN